MIDRISNPFLHTLTLENQGSEYVWKENTEEREKSYLPQFLVSHYLRGLFSDNFSDSIVNIQSSKNTISKTNTKLTYLGRTQFGIFAEC